MPDDQTSVPSENEDSPPVRVSSHDPLPLPPDVKYTRPVLKQGGLSGSSDIGSSVGSDDPRASSNMPAWGRGLSVSVTFAASILAGYLIGQWMDHHLFHSGSQVWGTLIMSIAGFAVGFYNIIRLTASWDKDVKRK
jgi:F0F1-type ATP synthase assembly protein I